MEDSVPSTPELSERKSRLSSNSGVKRNKVSRACDECRKRKVRCDGAQPCSRCQKSSTECIFSNVTPKRGPPKKYLEPFETRLKTIDSVLQVLESSYQHPLNKTLSDYSAEGMTENIDRNSSSNSNPTIETVDILDVTAIGHSLYTPDLPARIDRIEPIYKNSNLNSEPPPPSMDPTVSNALRVDLIQAYFEHIHPSIPFVNRTLFNRYQQPSLLLNAMYAVASKFTPSLQQHQQPTVADKDPPGWSFYKTALSLIDLYADVPRLSTIQAFLLLVKYQEYLHRPGFFWRTKLFLRLAIKMSNDLGLPKEAPRETQPTAGDQELETRRRTFWAVYAYDVLMSAELGLQMKFSEEQCTVNLPSPFSDDSNADVDITNKFYLLSKTVQTMAIVLRFMRSKYNNDSRHDEEMQRKFTIIESTLSELGASIPSIDENDLQLSFIHLIYHLTIILLYRTYALNDDVQKQLCEPYMSHCVSSSFYIANMVDRLVKTVGIASFYKVIRGHQQIIYCLSAAITIQRALVTTTTSYQSFSAEFIQEMYRKTSSLIQLLIKNSPSTEVESSTTTHQPSMTLNSQYRSDIHLNSPSNTSSTRSSPLIMASALNSPHSPNIPAPSIRKRHSRSSLHFPSTSSDMSYLVQSSASFSAEASPTIGVVGTVNQQRSTNRTLYANNRLSAPSLGSLYQQSPYFYQQQMQQQQQQQQQTQQMQQQVQQRQMTSYSQPSSPTATPSNGSNTGNKASNRNSWTAAPRRTTSLSRKRAGSLRRSASSIGEFIVPSQQRSINRNSAPGQPYTNLRKLTLTSNTPPDLFDLFPNAAAAAAPSPNNNAIPPSNTIQQQQQQQQQQHHTLAPSIPPSTAPSSPSPNTQYPVMMIDSSSFPMDPAIPDSPNESMMGLLMTPWEFSSLPDSQTQQRHHQQQH
ncbi:fungal-specific transcription factor domain-containing protein [Mycotypha africana]|uniref:fungal-specific transcription factor domain-containing protein n=1 Tax=Mycotypha africana TaxID=64632 RepID=UPI0023006D1D|nr:fungal-specific transcription factor domain-containing protein [Mycotypha africana]KAI8971543.1 fungal-specific transcription factor domain-containing protein [Mycotypha africana]